MKKKFISIAVLSTIISSMALGTVAYASDPNGDGKYLLNDVVLINQFVNGSFNVTNLTALDYNKNGVISLTDALQLQLDVMANNINTGTPTGDNSCMNDITLNETFRSYGVYDAQTGVMMQESYSIECCDTYNNVTTPYSIIGNTDDRVVDFTKSGVVKILTNNGRGTGFIVGPHCIATAAHVVDESFSFEPRRSAIISDILTFNTDGSLRNDTITPIRVHIPSKYYAYDSNYDYALITVEEDLSNYPIFDLGVYDSMTDRDITATITGFPGELENGNPGNDENTHIMYSGNGTVVSSNGVILNTAIDATEGNSGGPVYVTEYCNGNVRYTVFGILVADLNIANGFQYNRSIQIDGNLIRFYKNNPHVPE